MMNSNNCCGGKCLHSLIIKILLIIGGINWGLVGVGMLLDSNWNVVNMLLGGMPMVEAIVYILVGIAGILKIFRCGCAKCANCTCGVESTTPSTGGNMGSM